jgi:hypothetical protein
MLLVGWLIWLIISSDGSAVLVSCGNEERQSKEEA